MSHPPPFDNSSWHHDQSFSHNTGQPQPPQQNKKPRHRHSPHQLTALNELFEQNEHPPLEERSALAERLGMETKTVNAWFQNKRASSKKRVRGGASANAATSYENQVQASVPPPPPPQPSQQQNHDHHHHMDFDSFEDDYALDIPHSRSASALPTDYPPSSYAGHPDQAHFYSESDNMPRRMRMRPSSEQTDELKKLYNINPHPTTEQRQALSASIGMRYQSITNWFQNQRSLAKKRKEDEPDSYSVAATTKAEYPHEIRQYSAFPPPSHPHPSLGLPPPSNHASVNSNDYGSVQSQSRSRSVSPPMDQSPRRSSSRRSTTPYGSSSAHFGRPRRSRPEPYQLDALKELFMKTSTPTIEERSALALEIGMDVGKVTNWFRNLRQTARKRAKKSGSGDDEDDGDSFLGRDPYSASASRYGTPSFASSSSSMNEDGMDLSDYDMPHAHSDNGSEDDYQEAVTPSPDQSPSPPPPTTSVTKPVEQARNSYRPIENLNPAYPTKVATSFKGINLDDAYLLLSFHQHHVVHQPHVVL
ncbi:homeobox-domain-containing protein [Agrocybe pediades]|nr:homeobox-domain-containing protein [Agrocybe pediades]